MGIVYFDKTRLPVIIADAAVGGEHERRGPLGSLLDCVDPSGDDYFGKDTWEKAESEMQRLALSAALSKAKKRGVCADTVFAGDLINQCTVTANALGGFGMGMLGLYGACSTAAEGLLLASVWSERVGAAAAVTSSHNCSAERQFRLPVEYGGQRTPTAQWTATASGAFVLCTLRAGSNSAPFSDPDEPSPYCASVFGVMPGKIVDGGITDANNMGAAMAPAAADTVCRYLKASGSAPDDFDAIVTGDLGAEGQRLMCGLCAEYGSDVSRVSRDCGLILYDREAQDKHSGGSGCGCSAAVLSAYFLPRLRSGELKRILFVGTGALMSPMSVAQGMSIPGIAHAVELCSAIV